MSPRKNRWITISFFVILVALLSLTGIYRVEQGEDAMVLTFGEVTSHQSSGIYWRIPFIQSIQKASLTNIRTLEYGFRTKQVGTTTQSSQYTDVPEEAIMITGDGNIVNVEVIYQLVIKNVKSYFYEVDDPIGSLKLAFETVLRRNIQSKTLDDALLKKQEIEKEVLPDLKKIINNYKMGVEIRAIQIQNIRVPQEVTAAYEDVNNAKNEKTRKLDEAEKYKNEKIPVARAKAYQMIQSSEGYKAEKIAQATGDVANFENVYAKYLSSKEITRKRLMIETMENILSKVKTKYIMESNDGVMKFLPLAPVQAQTPAQTPAPVATPATTSQPKATTPPKGGN